MDGATCRLAENVVRRLYTHLPNHVRISVVDAPLEFASLYQPIVSTANHDAFLTKDTDTTPDVVVTDRAGTVCYLFVVPTESHLDEDLVRRVRGAGSKEATRAVVTYPALTRQCSAAVKSATTPVAVPDWFGAMAKTAGGSRWRAKDEQDIPVLTHRTVRSHILQRFGSSSRRRYVFYKRSHCYAR